MTGLYNPINTEIIKPPNKWNILHYNISFKKNKPIHEFKIISYIKADNSSPVRDFIKEQNPKMQAKILMKTELLEEIGNELEGKYTKHLDDGVFKLRVKFASDITRIFSSQSVCQGVI